VVFRFRQVRHPRWGSIVAIFSNRKIMEGEELLCNYGYNVDRQLVPDWYRQGWEEHNMG
jgi:hypothetical protein